MKKNKKSKQKIDLEKLENIKEDQEFQLDQIKSQLKIQFEILLNASFKSFAARTIVKLAAIIISILVLDLFIKIPYIFDIAIAGSIIITASFLHETFHLLRAKQLGYKPQWYREKWKMGFDIDNPTEKDSTLIARAPYSFILPAFSAILLLNLLTINHIGISIGCIITLILNSISYFKEGEVIETST